MPSGLKLVWPRAEYLPGYRAALERGWSADNVRGKVAADEELVKITKDSAAFLPAWSTAKLLERTSRFRMAPR
jgi:hypothetical protein